MNHPLPPEPDRELSGLIRDYGDDWQIVRYGSALLAVRKPREPGAGAITADDSAGLRHQLEAAERAASEPVRLRWIRDLITQTMERASPYVVVSGLRLDEQAMEAGLELGWATARYELVIRLLPPRDEP